MVIRMFAGTVFFADYWAKARNEFNEDFVAYVDEQSSLVSKQG